MSVRRFGSKPLQLEDLIRAGAFDCLDQRPPNVLRNQLLCVLPRAILAGQSKQDDRKHGQLGLFDDIALSSAQGGDGNGHASPLLGRKEPRKRAA